MKHHPYIYIIYTCIKLSLTILVNSFLVMAEQAAGTIITDADISCLKGGKREIR